MPEGVTYNECNLPIVEEFKKFYEDYGKDCKIDYANLGDKVMAVPSIKHKWVTRLCIYRNLLSDTKKQRDNTINEAIKKLRENSKVEISTITAKKKVESQDNSTISALNERIDLLERLVTVLEEIVQHMRYFGNEVSAIVDWVKMEQ